MGPTVGTYRWDLPLEPTVGTYRWDLPLGPTVGTYRWDLPLGPNFGSRRRDLPLGPTSALGYLQRLPVTCRPPGLHLRLGALRLREPFFGSLQGALWESMCKRFCDEAYMVRELARRSSYFGRVFSTGPACPQRGAPCKKTNGFRLFLS